MINFIAGGMMGDFIQSLYIVKNLCEKHNDLANVYISNGYGGDSWKFNMERTYNDLKKLIENQPYINKFDVLDSSNFTEEFINLNDWRDVWETYATSWSDLLSKKYNFNLKNNYKWIDINETNKLLSNKILIHRSVHRHNENFPWEKIINSNNDFVFLIGNEIEWEAFPFKHSKMHIFRPKNIYDIGVAINSCKFFIGNQSSPFSLSCAINVPRLVELHYPSSTFYMNEVKYYDNISWFLTNEARYIQKEAQNLLNII